MTKRSSQDDIKDIFDLSDLDKKVVDKRLNKRKPEKRNRRNRHYNKQFVKNAIKELKELEEE